MVELSEWRKQPTLIYLEISQIGGKTVVYGHYYNWESHQRTVKELYSSKDASEALQWALNYFPKIEIKGTLEINNSIKLQKYADLKGGGVKEAGKYGG